MGGETIMGKVKQVPLSVYLAAPVDTGLKIGLGLMLVTPVIAVATIALLRMLGGR